MTDISWIVFIAICFPFEGYLFITTFESFVLDNTNNPFKEIPKKEKDKQHLQLLKCMYMFMVLLPISKVAFGKDNPEKVYCDKVLAKREYMIVDYLHIAQSEHFPFYRAKIIEIYKL